MPSVDPTRTPRRIARAEPVGSLLRTPAVTERMDRILAGATTAVRQLVAEQGAAEFEEFDRCADDAVATLVQRQIDAGLDVVTDGEQRRASFHSPFYDAVDGLKAPAERIVVKNDFGDIVVDEFNDPIISGRLSKVHSPTTYEVSYLRELTDHTFKVSLPAPSYFLTDFVDLSQAGYADRQEFVDAVVGITKELVSDAIGAGARWIQFDFPVYPALVANEESPWGPMLDGAGLSHEELLDAAIAADSAVVEGLPDDVTTALHMCRGNIPGGFWSGDLDPIAERIFNELPHQRLLCEWENLGECDLSAIRFVPKDKIMVMGLLDTKTPVVEDPDALVRLIEGAAQHLPLDQLGLSPQCGFASYYGSRLAESEDVQWRKLDLVGEVADRVWGSD